MWFADRQEAGRLLAQSLLPLKALRPIVLAMPPGGVAVGLEVARALEAELDLVLAESIPAPDEPDLIIGAVGSGVQPQLVIDAGCVRRLDLPMDYVADTAVAAQAALDRRRTMYVGDRPPIDTAQRVVIVVDDGVGLDITMRAALRATKHARPARLVLAVPVVPAETIDALRQEVDELVCLGTAEAFMGVGQFYRCFPHLSDAAVTALLECTPLPAG